MRDAINRDGYVILPKLLSQVQVHDLRSALKQHFASAWNWEGLGKHQPNAANEIPSIGWIFSHPPIVSAIRYLTECSHPVFTANCDAHMNMLSWWHKDTGESQGGCFPGDYFASDRMRVYRVGIYLQDHNRDGHGLHVRPGSHHTKSVYDGNPKTLETRAGDVIIFDIRLTHAGQFADLFEKAMLRIERRSKKSESLYRLKQGWQRLKGSKEKLSLFMTYGAQGSDLDYYCDFEMRAKRMSCRAENLMLPPTTLAALAEQQVSVNPGVDPSSVD
jgi:hypothetical protein